MRFKKALVGVLTSVGVLSAALTGTQASAAPASDFKYVAIGDSFAAVGSLTKLDPVSRNPLCGFSKDNYAQRLASMMGYKLDDVTCGFSRTNEYWKMQTYPVPMPDRVAQRQAITPDTDLVTITLGGNDMGPESFAGCLMTRFTTGLGPSCREQTTPILNARMTGLQQKLEAIYRDAHKRAPHAKIMAVGYLKPVVTNQARCENYGQFKQEDIVFLEEALGRLNGIVEQAAKNTGTIYVAPHSDNGSCAPKNLRTTTMLGIQDDALMVHPTAYGHQVVAESIRNALNTQSK